MGADDRSWLTEDYPELRDARPWVMEEMILGEADLAPGAADQPHAAALAERILAAAERGEPIVTLGCGTSEHAALGVAQQLEEALRTRLPDVVVEARQAFEAKLDPRRGGVAIAMSHDGGTPATAASLAAARAAGATTAVITHRPEGTVAAQADVVLVTPQHDRSWCHTVGYVSPLCAGAAVAAALRGADAPGAALGALAARTLALRPALAAAAAALHGVSHLIVVGSGHDRTTARELTLKVEEGLHLPTAMRDLETFMHGHLPACDGRTGLVLIATDPRAAAERGRRALGLLEASAAVGIRCAALVGPAYGGGWPAAAAPAGRVELPGSDELPASATSLLTGAVALQLLTLELAHAAGTNPDLIRREQRPWREAAAIGDGG